MSDLFGFLKTYAAEFLILLIIGAVYLVNLGEFGIFESVDEIYYMEAAREMVLSGRWMVPAFNQEAFLDKPPLYIWLSALSCKVFGTTLLAVRLPAIGFALGGVALVYLLALNIYNHRTIAILSAIMLATSWGYFKATHFAGPDMAHAALVLLWVNLFWSWQAHSARPFATRYLLKNLGRWLGGVVGLLILLKGTFGLILPLALSVAFLVVSGRWSRLQEFNFRGFFSWLGVVTLPWLLWVSVAEGRWDFAFQYLFAMPLDRVLDLLAGLSSGWALTLLNLALVFLPWTLFVGGPFISYLGRRGERKVIDFQEPDVMLLLIWSVLGVLAFPANPVLVLSPLCLLTGAYVVNGMLEPRIPRSFRLATDVTILVMMGLAVYLTLSVFQALPDEFPGLAWRLPGIPEIHQIQLIKTFELESPFPVWKLWLLPAPVLLIITGFLLYLSLVVERYQWVIETLALGALIFCLFINGIVTPVFSRPVGESLASTLTRQMEGEDRVFIFSDSPELSTQLQRAVFGLPYRSGTPWLVFFETQQLNDHLHGPAEAGRLFGIIDEQSYYRLETRTRLQLRVLDKEWKWHVDPFTLLLPRLVTDQEHEGRIRDHLLLVERLVAGGEALDDIEAGNVVDQSSYDKNIRQAAVPDNQVGLVPVYP